MMLDAIDAHEAEALAPASTAESRTLRRIRLGPLLDLEEPLARTLGMATDGGGNVPALSSPASEESTISFDSTASSMCSTASTSSRASSTIARIVPHRFRRVSSMLGTPLDAVPGDALELVKHQSARGAMIGSFAVAIAACVGFALGGVDDRQTT